MSDMPQLYQKPGPELRVTVTDENDVVVFHGRVGDQDEMELIAAQGKVPRVRLTATGEGAFVSS